MKNLIHSDNVEHDASLIVLKINSSTPPHLFQYLLSHRSKEAKMFNENITIRIVEGEISQ